MVDSNELRTKLADIEHRRWASWQRWMHDQSRIGVEGSMVIPRDLWKRWERQIETAYADLTPAEQASDMEQVDRYWPLIEPILRENDRLTSALHERGGDLDEAASVLGRLIDEGNRLRERERVLTDLVRKLEWKDEICDCGGASPEWCDTVLNDQGRANYHRGHVGSCAVQAALARPAAADGLM